MKADHTYLSFIRQVVTPRRLDHSLGVMQIMEELAGINELDREKARTVGILHDAAKDLSPGLQERLVIEGSIQISYACETDYVYYLHAPVSAYFIRRKLGIADPEILGPIISHTFYGNDPHFHSPMSWCLRFADILEPTRNWEQEKLLNDGARKLRKLVYRGKIAESAALVTHTLIAWYET